MATTTLTRTLLLALVLGLTLPTAAQARPGDQGITGEIRQELKEARKEMRGELAQARRDLETGNLRLDDGVHFGRNDDAAKASLARAEITPQGDLLVDGKRQAIDAGQRRQLLAYRTQVIGIATAGIEAGQLAAEAALDAVGDSWISMLFNAMTGRLEERVERVVRKQIEPMVAGVCGQLPALMRSQHQLAATLPAFKPYATLEQRDIDECQRDFREEFASR
jgi:hypothetical protein